MYLFSLISLNVKLNAQNEFLGVQNANENDMIKYNYWAHGTTDPTLLMHPVLTAAM